MIQIKRIYEKPQKSDGLRILVERLWPRGLKKEEARVDVWLKNIAPSTDLRRWFDHDPEKRPEFQEQYRTELAEADDGAVKFILDKAATQTVTLLYAAKSEEMNSAVFLCKYLDELCHAVL